MLVVGAAGESALPSLCRSKSCCLLVSTRTGWSVNFFSGRAFVNRPDITSALGSFVVGLLGNLYGKATHSSGFVVMIVG